MRIKEACTNQAFPSVAFGKQCLKVLQVSPHLLPRRDAVVHVGGKVVDDVQHCRNSEGVGEDKSTTLERSSNCRHGLLAPRPR